MYRTVAQTPVVIIGRKNCQNDGVVGANIVTDHNGPYVDEHGHYEAQPVHFAKIT